MKTPKRVLRWEKRMAADIGLHAPTKAARLLLRMLWHTHERMLSLPPASEEYTGLVQTYGRTFDRLRALRRR